MPSGVWAAEEYEKLPPYDTTYTGNQPLGAFYCHQQDGRLCAGWVDCHDMEESLGLRMALATGQITEAGYVAACEYTTDVPTFVSGAEAAAHGLAGVEQPGPNAGRAIAKLARQRRRRPPS